MSGPCERRSSSHSAGPATKVSRQPRLPQRQIGPWGSTRTWPISPAMPRAPRKGRPSIDEAGADARGQAQVGHDVGAAADAEGRLAERADVGVVVEVDGQPEALLHLRRGVEPDPAGEDRLRVHEAALAVDRAGQAHARGEHAPALDARLLEQLGRPAWRRCRGRPRRRCRPRAPRRTRRGSSTRGRRRRRAGESWPKSRPTTAPAERSSATSTGGRPPCEAVAATPSVARSTTIPAAWRSATRLDTVERLRPVWRAMSARLIAPRVRSASMTRRRLRSRRDSSDPVRSGPTAATLSDRRGVCQEYGRRSGRSAAFRFRFRTNLPRRRRPPAPRRGPWRCRPDRCRVTRHRRP